MSLLELMVLVLTYNLLTFGSGSTMIPLLQQHLVPGVLSLDQFLYAFAIGRVTPGQANLYVGAIGYMTHGVLGALAMMVAIQVPGYLVLPLVKSYERFRSFRPVRGLIRGLTATAVGIVLGAAYGIGRATLTSGIAVVVFAATLLFVLVLRWNALLAIVVSVALGAGLKFTFG